MMSFLLFQQEHRSPIMGPPSLSSPPFGLKPRSGELWKNEKWIRRRSPSGQKFGWVVTGSDWLLRASQIQPRGSGPSAFICTVRMNLALCALLFFILYFFLQFSLLAYVSVLLSANKANMMLTACQSDVYCEMPLIFIFVLCSLCFVCHFFVFIPPFDAPPACLWC